MSNLQGKGICIVITGPNGGGKSTAGPLIAQKLTEAGHETVYLYGPGVTEAAKALASLVKNKDTSPSSKFSQALVWLAQHAESLRYISDEYIEKGINVILDRGPETTWIYNINGILDGRELEGANGVLNALYGMNDGTNRPAVLRPELVLVFDLPIETAMVRMGQQSETDQFQDAATEEHERRRTTYVRSSFGQRTKLIDASGPLETVVEASVAEILPLLTA